MLRSTALLRHLARLAILLPLAAACGSEGTAQETGGPSEAGSGDAGTDGEGNGPDVTPPTVVSSYPLDTETGASTLATMSATFSEAMAPASLTNATFGVKQGAAVIPGAVSYFNKTVTFTPASKLDLSTTYTATVTTAATDLAGNPLAAAYSWSFTTDVVAPIGPLPVALGGAGKFAILAQSKITNVPTSKVTGDMGISPAAAITGFDPLTLAGTKFTSPQVNGGVFTPANALPTPLNLTTAVNDELAAYTDAAGRTKPKSVNNLGNGAIGGLTFTPGLYKWDTAVTMPLDITISGARNDTWIFQITGELSVTAATRAILIGGAQAKNIVWQVAGAANLGATSHFEGVLMSKTAITVEAGAFVNGRLLAQTAITFNGNNTITAPAP